MTGESLLSKWNIPITNLDYSYIKKSQNAKELERIVRILRSGQEGHYPDLLKTAENRLREVNPKSRYLHNLGQVLKGGVEELSDIKNWCEEVTVLDQNLQNCNLRSSLPEIRRSSKIAGDHKPKPNTRLKSWDYAAWDKYDPDLEELKEQLAEEEARKAKAKIKAKKVLKTVSFKAEVSEVEAELMANGSRIKGNEFYKVGDFEEALKLYSESIRLFGTVEAFNNRCITYLKLKKYKEALKDCNEVLRRDPQNIKGLLRKSQIFKELKEYDKAYTTLEELISIEPNNMLAQTLMTQIRKNVPNIEPKTRLIITEIDDEEEIIKQETKQIIVPIPSTSSYEGPCVKIVEVHAEPKKLKEKETLEDPRVKNIKPVSRDLNSCGEPQPTVEDTLITTPYQFIKAWQAVQNGDLRIRSNVLRKIPTDRLITVIGNKLDPAMFGTILSCLQSYFMVASEINFVANFLKEIVNVERFDLIAMFMEKAEKQVLKNLISFLKQHGVELDQETFLKLQI